MSVFSTIVIIIICGVLLSYLSYYIYTFLLKKINKRYIIKTIEINRDRAENDFCKYTIGRCIAENNPFRNKRFLIIDCKEYNNDYYYKYVYVEINERGEMIPPVFMDTGSSFFRFTFTETKERYFKN